MILVFTEMMELNSCKLSENIKRNISNRADKDEEDLDIPRESLIELEGNYNVNQDNNINNPSNL